MHNGIIENYLKLKQKLEKKGYEFVSETDTEVLAHLLDYYYQGNPLQAITKVMHRVEGSYALGINCRRRHIIDHTINQLCSSFIRKLIVILKSTLSTFF